MNRFVGLLLGFTCFAMSGAYAAATLVPVAPYPGSTTTQVFAINDHNVISGEYTMGDGIEHGFFGPLGGPYTSFDYPGTAIGTEARSINNMGVIVGFAPDTGFNMGPEFFRKPDGTLVTIEKNHVPVIGIAQGVNKQKFSVGDYVTNPDPLALNGYEAKAGVYQHDLTPDVDATRLAPRGINNNNAIAGWYTDSSHLQHGFILTAGGTQIIDADTSGTTTLEGLNDNGIASGAVLDDEENFHAFALDTATSAVTWIDVPGATNVQAWGINKRGYVALSSDIGSYIYCPFKASRCPAGGTEVVTRTSLLPRPGTHLTPRIPQREPRRGAAR